MLAASGRRPVSTPVIAAAVRSVLHDEPGVFAPVASHAATEAALVAVSRELRDVSEVALVALGAAGERAVEVIRVHRLARQRLEANWNDEDDLLRTAAHIVRTAATTLSDLGAIIVYLPQRLSLGATDLLSAMAEWVDVDVIAGQTGDRGADHDVDRVARSARCPQWTCVSVGNAQ